MKRGTPRHPKVVELAEQLKVPVYSAVGILELLWHFTAEFAHSGDIGRFSDAAIAKAMCWDGDSTVLVSCLHYAGWLDACECHRFRVHDWPDHADQTVQRVLSKRNQGFLKCYDDASTVLAQSKHGTSQPSPSPLERERERTRGELDLPDGPGTPSDAGGLASGDVPTQEELIALGNIRGWPETGCVDYWEHREGTQTWWNKAGGLINVEVDMQRWMRRAQAMNPTSGKATKADRIGLENRLRDLKDQEKALAADTSEPWQRNANPEKVKELTLVRKAIKTTREKLDELAR